MPLLSADEIIQTRQAIVAAGVFSELATIREYTTTISPSGGQIKTWKDKTSHVSIPCSVSSREAQEQRANLVIQTTLQTKIKLSSYYPLIQTAMRAVCNGVTYEITSVGADSQTLFTTLMVQVVTV